MHARFEVPPTILVGGGVSGELGAQAKRLEARRALIVTDDFLVRSGLVERMAGALRAAGIEATVFSGVQPDPTVANVLDGLAELQRGKAELVVGLGGGSPIDAAKAVAILATNLPPIGQYEGYEKFGKAGLPLIAIPTTAGTGSEVTRAAVITDTERDVKMLFMDARLIPRVALVDYELTMSMPRHLTAHVGVDTLTHGIEAYVSRRASSLTDPIALSCIELVTGNLATAFAEPQNRPARAAMMTAACQGGMAFANSSVALVHGMSRPIGAHFHVPHGLSNAVLLPAVTEFSLPGAPERYATIARRIGVASMNDSLEAAGQALLRYLVEFNRQLEIGRLRDAVRVDWNTFAGKLDAMAEAALASGSPQNNPRVPSAQEIIELYRRAW